MGTFALLNAFVYAGQHDFTADANKLDFKAEAAALDKTTFRNNRWNENEMGLKSFDLNVAGLWQAGSNQVDDESFNNLGVAQVTTFGAVETEGSACMMLQQMPLNYQLLGALGEMTPFTLAGKNSGVAGGVVRGKLLKALGDVSATGATGTASQAGAVAADKYLYATFHVFSAGTTITAVVESDDNASFTSATTRITFGPYTTTGGRWATRVAGAITDDYWRIRVTAITGTFSIAAAIAIQ